MASHFLKPKLLKKAICLKLWKCTSDSEPGNFHFTSKCQKYFIKGSASKTSLQEESKQIKETDIQKLILQR